MIASNAFGEMLSVFATGTREQRVGISNLSTQVQVTFGDSYHAVSRVTQIDDPSTKAYAAIVTLTQLLWSIVPTDLIENVNPDFHALAANALNKLFANAKPDKVSVESLVVIFKRIRKFHRLGRSSPSLNLDHYEHKRIFEDQLGKCAHCGYQFLDDLSMYAPEEDGYVVTRETSAPKEITLERTFRRPELDHIIPVILGGDSYNNYQILCKSCNVGKSDHLTYLSAITGPTYGRLGHLFDMTAAKRYGVIAREKSKNIVSMTRGDNKQFRVFRIKENYHLNPENLRAEYS
jgi:5-methylcytosine-specific restriction endonuclease McrA